MANDVPANVKTEVLRFAADNREIKASTLMCGIGMLGECTCDEAHLILTALASQGLLRQKERGKYAYKITDSGLTELAMQRARA